jgi:hypothetical protein
LELCLMTAMTEGVRLGDQMLQNRFQFNKMFLQYPYAVMCP